MANNEKVVPFLNVSDGDASAKFFCEQLGFTREWTYQPKPDAPRCVCVTLGTAKLYLSEFDETAKVIKLVVWVDDIEPILETCRQADTQIEIAEQGHFGTVELRTKDPDGNNVLICQRPEDGP